MIRDMVIKSLYELMLPESADEKRAYAELVIRELDALRERAEKSEAMVERMIEAGAPLVAFAGMMNYKDAIQILTAHINNWNALVAEWKERE